MNELNSEENVRALLEQLASAEPRRRANALRALAEAPVAEQRLLSAAESMLADESLTILSIPYLFGEVRWHAAAAVAALRGALQVREHVHLLDVPGPLTTDKIDQLATQAGLGTGRGGIDGVLETLEQLRALGLIPRRNIVREP
ncbi:MAG: hypothetical protein IPH44_21705 [Myxococcales bacterium]|nr:hypothetical protein [Myxococcales bacterium]MBK7191975.1 hypothetical protein [Myxococcales bacterium]MBP6842188.1 hypothetical protein [Kofleriaceae bacterium]